MGFFFSSLIYPKFLLEYKMQKLKDKMGKII